MNSPDWGAEWEDLFARAAALDATEEVDDAAIRDALETCRDER